jgi:NAD(P)-dependent dehydrogenase (short-subunit alcohol dehydrogenase family)
MPDTNGDEGRKIAVLTGGSRGLGCSSVLNLARRGVDVVFTYAVNAEMAEEVVAEAGEEANVVAMQLDLADVASFDGFARDLKEQLGKLGRERFDFLVNNAGASLTASFEETTEEQLDQQYAVNFKGMFFLTQKLLPLLEDGGRILNFSSGLVRFTFPNKIGYATIKSSVEPFTRYLATELAGRGIAVNAIAPGAVGTDFSDGLIRDDPQYRKRVSAVTALGRPGVPEDIGPMVAALLSEDARWVNGERIEVSGGMKL